MSPIAFNLEALANQLSDEQFEILLRTYIRRQLQSSEKNPQILMLVVSTGYGTIIENQDAHWTIGHSGADQVKGEILAKCIAEYNRRVNFTSTCTLRLIEAPPEAITKTDADVFDTKALDDQIPF